MPPLPPNDRKRLVAISGTAPLQFIDERPLICGGEEEIESNYELLGTVFVGLRETACIQRESDKAKMRVAIGVVGTM